MARRVEVYVSSWLDVYERSLGNQVQVAQLASSGCVKQKGKV